MSEISRREALTHLAAAFAAAGAIDRVAALEAHELVRQVAAGEAPAPAALTAGQFRTLQRLADLVVPSEAGRPGAVEAAVPVWIDALLHVNADLRSRYVDGLGWLDATMTTRHGLAFAAATPEQQRALLDVIAFQKNRSPENDPGIDFFILARRMTVDGFYTSPIGMRDIYPGNTARTAFTVPQDAMDYVVGRSPFRP
jgi:gluconate 2-dehydrogenase gamma chain